MIRLAIGAFVIVAAITGFAAAEAKAEPPKPKICEHHAEHYDSPNGFRVGNTYIPACAIGNGGGPAVAPRPAAEPAPEEPTP